MVAAISTVRAERWRRRARVGAITSLALAILFGLFGFLVAPGLVKSQVESQIGAHLGRRATVGAVRVNPFLLAVTLDDFKLYDAAGRDVALAIDELRVDASSASLFRRALVLDRLAIVHPAVRIARIDADRFDFSDIVDRLAAGPKSDSPTLFSLNNIELDGGTIDVDDRVAGRKHRVEGLRIALPFISNLPHDTAIFVTPEFAATIDGSTLRLSGKAQPFSTTRESAIALSASDIDLPDYVDLVPAKLPFRLASGKLSFALDVTFRGAAKDESGKATPQSLGVSGHVGLAGLAIAARDGVSGGARKIGATAIDVDLAKVDPLNAMYAIERVAIVEPFVDATRRADGTFDLADLLATSGGSPAKAPPAKPATAAPPTTFTVADLHIARGRAKIVDETLAQAATVDLKSIDVDAKAIALSGATPTTAKIAIALDDGASLDADVSTQVARRAATGTIAIKGFRPARVAPYLASVLAARIDDGTVAADARFAVDASGPEATGTIDGIAVRVEKLRTSLPGETAPFVAAESIALDGGRFDLVERTFSAESVKLVAPAIAIRRDAKGRLNLNAAIVEAKPVAQVATPAAKGAAVAVVPARARPFVAVVKSLAVERGDVSVEDLAATTPVRLRVRPLAFTADNVGTSTIAVVPFTLDAVFDQRGRLAVKGRATVAPLDLDATIDAKQVPVGWFAAYAGERLNVVVDTADLDARGSLKVSQPKAADAPLAVAYRGSFGIARMRALDKLTSDEFVRWKSLDVPLVDLRMPAPNAPMAVVLGPVALSDFYARLIVNADGRVNLQDVVASPGGARSVTTADAQPASPAPTVVAAPTAATTPVATSAGPRPIVRIGGIKLANGRVGITDNFVKPNYSANLTDLNGQVAAVASDDPKPAALKLAGRIDGDGTLDVSGTMNPLAATLSTDIAAEAKDIELTRLSTYAIKYAGYGIERGKLSMTLKYRIDNGRLEAQNRLFLDQLAFGEHDAQSTANLPVRLAVALLADRNGVIDVELPVSGSLSDPQFSIGGVLWRAFVNLVARAVTSPFALIGSAFGGGTNGELGYIQFKPGSSDLTDMGKSKLETLAKALAERPKIRLDIVGRYDPATDPDGIRRDHLLDRLKDAKAKDQSKGAERVGRDQVTLEAGTPEYAKYLAQVYDDTKLPDKPRNAIGIAKSIPADDMERLLLAATSLDANDPRWLAEARADVVRHDLEDTGKIAPGRVFLVAPKLTADGIADPGVPNRVDFVLR